MRANLERGKAESGVRSVGRFAILAGVSLIATLALSAPDPALAACGGTSHPAHAAASGGGGTHAATSTPPSGGGGGGGGGGGSSGCANGNSAVALHGLPMAVSGRVVEGGNRSGARTATHARTNATKGTNASAHAVRPAHHA